MKVLLVLLGGSIGAVCRYGVNLLAVRLWGSGFPWGTLVVNLAGCLLIGLAFGLAERSSWVTPSVRLFFVTGFLGALTTFSSFAIETVNTANAGLRAAAALNFVAQNAGGLALVLVGLWLAKVL
ncbi:MAG: fluoride efflux transporter CrcB [Planctomycetes bacterium]|nr:fluoride efflux transporter CrcB [Planctomycetota bacterium]